MANYVNVALPSDLVEQIDKVITKRAMGYRSRGEFVKEAVRYSLRTWNCGTEGCKTKR